MLSKLRKPHPQSEPDCPHCDSVDVVVEAYFGSSLMTRQYYCRSCKTVFERVKWDEVQDVAAWLGDPVLGARA